MGKIIDLYFITCLSNLHAGSGDATYGIIDKEVQRDAKGEFPVVHSSGLKGSFRELAAYHYKFKTSYKGSKEGHDADEVKEIFGSEKDSRSGEKLKNGTYTFHDAHLLFLPVRSNIKPYFLATSIEQLAEFTNMLENHYGIIPEIYLFLKKVSTFSDLVNKPIVNDDFSNAYIEDEKVCSLSNFLMELEENKRVEFKEFFEKLNTIASPLVLFPYKSMKEQMKELPVIARNNLENGISKNLWYEEVVPRQSIFYFFISRHNSDDLFYKEVLAKNNLLVQIGANATIGYGLCKTERKLSGNFPYVQPNNTHQS